MKVVKSIAVAFFSVLFSYGQAIAEPSEGQTPLLKVQPLKNATMEYSEARNVQRYLLPLGAMIKINGKWRSKKRDILSGELTRSTYLLKDDESFDELRNLDGNLSLKELYQYYFKQLKDQSAAVLFECRGRNCGSSNQWGNGFVDNKRMVGRDRDQAYIAAKLNSDSTESFVAIYMVKNVTGETRVHVDHLMKSLTQNVQKTLPSKVKVMLGRVLVIPAAELDQSSSLNPIIEVLKAAKQESGNLASLYLVGHAYGDGSVAALKQKSLDYAKQLQQKITEPEAKLFQAISIEGFGPLAPMGEGKDQLDRVELILH